MNIDTEPDSSYQVIAGLIPQMVAAAAVLIGFWLAGILVQRVIRRIGLVADPDKRDILWFAGRASKIVLILIVWYRPLARLASTPPPWSPVLD